MVVDMVENNAFSGPNPQVFPTGPSVAIKLTPLEDFKKAASFLYFSIDLLCLTLFLRMTVYSTKERKTNSMQANSHTSMAVTAFDTGIRALDRKKKSMFV